MATRETVRAIITLCLVGFELSVLAVLAFFPYLPDPGLSNFNTDIYVLLSPFSTMFLLGLLYIWLVKFGTGKVLRRSIKFRTFVQFLSVPFRNLQSSLRTVSLSNSARSFRILSRPRLMLGTSLLASVLLTFIPYRPDLNPNGVLVGIDSPTYVSWINQMLQRPLLQALQYSFVEGLDGSRPLLLIPLYLIASAGISPDLIIEYLPILLAPLLSLSSYFFVRFWPGERESRRTDRAFRVYLRLSNIVAEGWELIDVLRSILVVSLLRNGLYMVHAAAVKIGDRGVLIPAFGNTGKTTTAWMLASGGAEFLTDEFAVLDSDGSCFGFPCSSLLSPFQCESSWN